VLSPDATRWVIIGFIAKSGCSWAPPAPYLDVDTPFLWLGPSLGSP
jgi:hypothetical protein